MLRERFSSTQLCAIQAIKKRLVAARRYPKDKSGDIINKSTLGLIDSLNEKSLELLAEHCDKEKYIWDFYQPKEPQFCRAYTRTYLNL
jgi:hypothetical protein